MPSGGQALLPRPGPRNLTASLLMVATMAGFAVEDLLLKLLSATVPVGQLLLMLGLGGGAFFAAAAALRKESLRDRRLLTRPVLLRNAAEVVASMSGITALVLLPLSLFSSIFQAAPLVAAAGAALFLRERVGWRRWTAICIGLAGVLLILHPGGAGGSAVPSAFGIVCAIVAVLAVALRDLATRATPPGLTTLQLAFWGYATTIISGVFLTVLRAEPWVWPDAQG
jgi:drug/metabolite transporter (DMT)-like permease